MGEIFTFYYSWSLWDPKASDICFCASCHVFTLLPPSFTSHLFCLFCFLFFLYPLAPGLGFSTEGARGALQSMIVASSNCTERGVPTAWVTRATFLSLASENIVSSISQTLTSGKFPGSPRRLTCSWFCTAQQLLCRCEHSPSTRPVAAVWPGDRLLLLQSGQGTRSSLWSISTTGQW